MRKIVMAAVVLLPSAASAQELPDTVRLRELVVTATRFAVPLAEAPGSVTIITAADMRDRGVRSVADALRMVPGVSVAQSAGPGALTSVFVRGGESDYVQVLVDGVQVNDPGGAFNWAHLRAEDVERIEVVRGPASVLYGSDAVAGVVQIFTRAGGPSRVSGSITSAIGERPRDYGTYGTHTFDIAATGSGAPRPGTALRYGVSAGHTTSSGLYEFNSGYDNTTVNGKLQLEAGSADVALTGRRIGHGYHYPTTGSGMVMDRNQFTEGSARSAGLDAGYRPAPGLELRLGAALHATDARTENPPDEEGQGSSWDTAEQTRRTLDARANLSLPFASVLTLGAEREWQQATTAYESVSEWGTFADSADHERTNTGAYAQLHTAPARRVSATLGLRLDDNDAFGRFRTGRAAISWRPAAAARVHAAFGTAFKEPTFFENYATGYTRGNPELEPERTRSWEAGAEYALLDGKLVLGGTWFDQRFRNLIQYTFSAPAPDAPNFFNVGAATARGLELTAQSGAGAVEWNASYTYVRTRVEDAGFGEDRAFREESRLLRRPTHQAFAGLAVPVTGRLRALADIRFVGERDDLDFTDPEQWRGRRVTLDAYALLGAGVTFGVLTLRGRTLDTSVRLSNISITGDGIARDYAEIYNFPAAGPTLSIGLRY